jgi:hypothetical protein
MSNIEIMSKLEIDSSSVFVILLPAFFPDAGNSGAGTSIMRADER